MNVPGTTVTLPRGRAEPLIRTSHVAFNFRPPLLLIQQFFDSIEDKDKIKKKDKKILSKNLPWSYKYHLDSSFLDSLFSKLLVAARRNKDKNKSLDDLYIVIVTFDWHRSRVDAIRRIRIETASSSFERNFRSTGTRIEEEKEEHVCTIFSRASSPYRWNDTTETPLRRTLFIPKLREKITSSKIETPL